jgi:hypothetical protein
MPGLKRGARGDSVKALQELLNEQGAKLVVDGIYGPATEAAVRSYQKANGYTQNGQVGTTLYGLMDLPVGGSTGGGVATSKTGSDLELQGEWELWYDTDAKQWIAVKPIAGVVGPDGKRTPDSYISWTIESDEDLEAVVGVDVDPKAKRTVNEAQLTQMGVVNFGGVDELRDWGGFEGDPLDSWEEDMARLAITRPWILDDDWINLSVMAIFEREDPTLTLDEIQTTEFYRTHSDSERRWMEMTHGDPATAAQWEADSREATAIKLRNAGINNVPDDIADYMAMQVVTGAWTPEQLDFQITAISDPYSNIDPDAGLLREMSDMRWSPDATQEKEDTVRNLYDKWLGPAYGNANDQTIANWAGKLRNDPDAELDFIEQLKSQRVAMFPGTEDRNVSYQDLAMPWKNFQQRAWGVQTVDETDPMFLTMLRNNDIAANGQLLQEEGMTRNVGKVVTDTSNAIQEAWGGTQR